MQVTEETCSPPPHPHPAPPLFFNGSEFLPVLQSFAIVSGNHFLVNCFYDCVNLLEESSAEVSFSRFASSQTALFSPFRWDVLPLLKVALTE